MVNINFICLRFNIKIISTICIILILITFLIIQIKNTPKKQENIQISFDNSSIIKNIITSSKNENKTKTDKPRLMKKSLNGFEIVGKIEIPKLNVEKYILNITNSKSLNVSVTKVCGPEINQIGNFCIAGHNYNKVFGKIKTLQKNDKIILTDVYGNNVVYQVYDKFECSPKDTSCLNQDTNSEKEITLITCKLGAIKRIIVKAVEIYD